MPIRPKRKPAWQVELENAQTIAAVGRTRSGARRNQIADDEDRANIEAVRRQRAAATPEAIAAFALADVTGAPS